MFRDAAKALKDNIMPLAILSASVLLKRDSKLCLERLNCNIAKS